jgi:RNA polymerase sporulation-specific sigma factor
MSQDQIFNTPETLVLITQAKQGDADAFDILLTQYGPLIEHRIQTARARRPDILPEDEKDLRQEAHLAFYRALLSYNAEQQNVSFGLYAKICIENALISALRKLAPIADLLDYETMISLPADREEDPSLRLREQEDYEALSRRIARILSPFENRIWQRYIAGMTAPDIARQLKKDTRSIHNAIYRIRNKLRNASGITDKK